MSIIIDPNQRQPDVPKIIEALAKHVHSLTAAVIQLQECTRDVRMRIDLELEAEKKEEK